MKVVGPGPLLTSGLLHGGGDRLAPSWLSSTAPTFSTRVPQPGAQTSVTTRTAAADHDAKTDVHQDPVAPVGSTAPQTVDQEAPTGPGMVWEGQAQE